jgi:YidC/Oxa1 family membrane protein insertase
MARTLTIEKILFDGKDIRLSDVEWSGSKENSAEAETVAFECTIEHEGVPALRLIHRYRLKPQPESSHRYDLRSELTLENLTDGLRDVRVTQRGPVGLTLAEPRADERRVAVGLFADGVVSIPGSHLMTEVSKNNEAMRLYEAQRSEGRLWWMAAANKYFSFITTPVKPDGSEDPGSVIEALALDLDTDAATHDDVTLRWVSDVTGIPPGESRTLAYEHYLGPLDKRAFSDSRNAEYLRRNFHALYANRGDSWCTFSFLTELMVWLLDLFHVVTRNYGLAIILLVVLVRLILHPVTKSTQVNMMRMQQSMATLQPKIEEIKKRIPNDKQRQQQEILAAYREAGVNPAGQMFTCLPMVLQMPIWVALYTSLNNNIAMRHEGFFLWIKDLTSPDKLIEFGTTYHVPLIGLELHSFNLLPILMAITMYAQQKLMTKLAPTPKNKAPMSEQAEMMQKQMQMMGPIMSVVMAFIFYNMPSGLNLYIMTSSIGGALEQWRIRKHVAAEQERGESGPGGGPGGPKPKKPDKPSWFERMAKAADEAQKLKSARK